MKGKLILILITLCMTVGFMGTVSAGSNDSAFSRQQISGAYYYQRDKDTGKTMVGTANKFYMNGKLAYCIEPLVQITDHTYNSTSDWNVTSLTPEQRHRLELIGFYGYEYNGHQTDRFYMATQELIWETVKNVDAKYTTQRGGGSEIDLSHEKNEIMKLVNNYEVKPSFNTKTVEGNIGDEITVEDTNGVLEQFYMEYSGKHKVTVNGNKISIKLDNTTVGEDTIRFKRKDYSRETTLIYYKDDSQKLASLRISDPSVATLKIKSNGGTLEINKKGEKVIYDNGTYKYETIQLPNVTYALYANEDIKASDGTILYKKYDLVGTLTSNELGIATLKGLYYGKYFLIEGESSQGNLVNEEKYYFEITTNDLIDGKIVKHLDMQNYLPKGELIFSKVDLTDGKPIANTIVQIFTDDDKLIFTGTTDLNGQIVIKNLPVGKFYIIEKNPSTGYKISDEKVYFEIKSNGEIVKAQMTNEKIKGDLIFKKVDEDGNALAGVKIGVYRKDGSLYGTYVTDKDGLVYINNIEYGEYEIRELSTIDGYELEDDTLYFSILDDGKVVELSMVNKKLPQTAASDYTKDIAILLIAVGGVIVIVKLRKKQK